MSKTFLTRVTFITPSHTLLNAFEIFPQLKLKGRTSIKLWLGLLFVACTVVATPALKGLAARGMSVLAETLKIDGAP